MSPAEDFLTSSIQLFKYYKGLADKTFEQLGDDDIRWRPNDASNSIGIIVRHISGNILSRFTDFLTSDGEKPWRDRDAEFEREYQSKVEMIKNWEASWALFFATLDKLQPADLEKVVFVRNEGHSVLQALNRQLAHYSSHIGQIIYIGKAIKSSDFKTLSIARGGSQAFNKEKFSSEKTVKHFTDKA